MFASYSYTACEMHHVAASMSVGLYVHDPCHARAGVVVLRHHVKHRSRQDLLDPAGRFMLHISNDTRSLHTASCVGLMMLPVKVCLSQLTATCWNTNGRKAKSVEVRRRRSRTFLTDEKLPPLNQKNPHDKDIFGHLTGNCTNKFFNFFA